VSTFYSAKKCLSISDQHWEMAGLARTDGDFNDARLHTVKALTWQSRARDGGWSHSDAVVHKNMQRSETER